MSVGDVDHWTWTINTPDSGPLGLGTVGPSVICLFPILGANFSTQLLPFISPDPAALRSCACTEYHMQPPCPIPCHTNMPSHVPHRNAPHRTHVTTGMNQSGRSPDCGVLPYCNDSRQARDRTVRRSSPCRTRWVRPQLRRWVQPPSNSISVVSIPIRSQSQSQGADQALPPALPVLDCRWRAGT